MLTDFELTEPERVLLLQAARTADLLDDLQTRLDDEGIMAESSQGIRVHPCAVELRQQRIALARLWAALRVPIGEQSAETGRTQHRGIRGIYSGGLA